jgi:hypothetical protein
MWTLTVVDAATRQPLRTVGSTEVGAPQADVRLVLGAAAALAGRVVDEQGRGVAGAIVSASNSAGATLPRAVADGDGRFQWTGVEDGSWTVQASEPATGRGERAGLPPGASEVSIVLRVEAVVAAKLVDVEGRPARAAEIALRSGDVELLRLRTDAEGRFAAKSLRAGTYEVRLVELDGRALATPLACGAVAAGATDTVLRIPRE